MPLVDTLPPELENPKALLARRKKAAARKELWRSSYTDCYRFAMPARETFTWQTEGQLKNQVLYDSTLQEATYTAANTLCALLFPSWTRWAELAPGGAIPKDKITSDMLRALNEATEIFFDFLNHSNFAQVINEVALDLMVGTGALDFDEGDTDEQPFKFSATPLSAIEIEEGPNGKVETTWMCRKPLARNIARMYPGISDLDFPQGLEEIIATTPEMEVELIQGEVYHPQTGNYYGVVIWAAGEAIIWRYNYETSCPKIVARATKVAGEIYGRGRVMLALSDARTLDKMQEFVLRQSALAVAGCFTGVSDGVLNPYTAVIAPGVVIPVASNDSGNPSLSPIEVGGNFNITEKLMTDLRQRVRRTMIGPEPTEGAVRSATEVGVNDRNRLWAMNGEFSRIQAELLSKIIARGVFILQRRGLMPKIKVDGRQVSVKYTSPFAKSQNADDVNALQNTFAMFEPMAEAGMAAMGRGLKLEDAPAWVAMKNGVPAALIRNEEELAKFDQAMKDAAAQQQAAQSGGPAQ